MKVRAAGEVVEIIETRDGAALVGVAVDGMLRRAWNFDRLSGRVRVGDRVLVNTAAVELGLGTGGVDFVVANLRRTALKEDVGGHIMKLRYTPVQVAVESVEAQESAAHKKLKSVSSIKPMTVIAGGLHSQLAPVCVTAKAIKPDVRIAYVMTDGGALPIAISDVVRDLKSAGLLDVTITAGNAFGGDYEAVTVFSALAAAKLVARADLAVVMMGPGIVGTATELGHTGLEQGQLVNAIAALGGTPVAIPRVLFADVRKRHKGVSHHTLTALGTVALARCTVVVAAMRGARADLVASQLHDAGVFDKHNVVVIENDVTLRALRECGIRVSTMGRTPVQEPEFFATAGASAIWALREAEGRRGGTTRGGGPGPERRTRKRRAKDKEKR